MIPVTGLGPGEDRRDLLFKVFFQRFEIAVFNDHRHQAGGCAGARIETELHNPVGDESPGDQKMRGTGPEGGGHGPDARGASKGHHRRCDNRGGRDVESDAGGGEPDLGLGQDMRAVHEPELTGIAVNGVTERPQRGSPGIVCGGNQHDAIKTVGHWHRDRLNPIEPIGKYRLFRRCFEGGDGAPGNLGTVWADAFETFYRR